MVLLTNKYKQLRSREDIEMVDSGNDVIGGGNSFILTSSAAPSQLIGENVPTQKFDLSVISGLSAKQKYRGNLVRDIQEVYQTYITGSPVGRGGTYALDNVRRFGVTITEGARKYLEAVLPIFPEAVTNKGNGTGTGGGGGTEVVEQVKKVQDTLQKQIDEIKKGFDSKDTIKILSDSIKDLFGNAVALQPLQSQATGYTPVTATSPLGTGAQGGGSSIGVYIILAIVGVIVYFVYKRFAS